MNIRYSFTICLGILVSVIAGHVLAQPADLPGQTDARPAPTTGVDPATCTDAGCHADVADHAFVHGPVNVNACDACHTLVEPAQHEYKMSRPINEMCGFCHVVETEGMDVVHQPLVDGQCSACHDPHGGSTQSMLKAQTVNELCSQCHDDVIGDNRYVHGPVAAQVCGACHQPHASQFPKLLNTSGKDLCVQCHAATERQIKSMRVTHQPAIDNCQGCHDAHASNHRMMLSDETQPLCLSCHQPIADTIANATVKHSAVTTGQSCLACHQPHAADHDALLPRDTVTLCFECHAQPVESQEGRLVGDVQAEFASGSVKHGPVAQGECAPCHQVHGSQNYRLLIEPYPAEFYTGFEPNTYELCYECHNQQQVLEPQTDALTDFRNGTRNLHYLHVNKDRKGRTCRACHETHASDNPKHVREGVPFGTGGWVLPINFQKTETGGSCTPGCHRDYTYDRQNPVQYADPQARTQGDAG